MTALTFVQNTLYMLFNLFFNSFKLPNTDNVYIGWVLISALTMGIMLKTILNIPRSIPSLKKERQGSQNGQ